MPGSPSTEILLADHGGSSPTTPTSITATSPLFAAVIVFLIKFLRSFYATTEELLVQHRPETFSQWLTTQERNLSHLSPIISYLLPNFQEIAEAGFRGRLWASYLQVL